MPIHAFLVRLLGIARTIQAWHGALLALDAGRREKLASYAEEIAATFARAAQALMVLEAHPAHLSARRDAVRELGRISGYLDDLVSVLDDALDGRKVSGLRRRLAQLGSPLPATIMLRTATHSRAPPRLESLLDAEGYFRALADGLRASGG
jgi:hypothetical protein